MNAFILVQLGFDLFLFKKRDRINFIKIFAFPNYFERNKSYLKFEGKNKEIHSAKILPPQNKDIKTLIFQIHGGGFQHGGLEQLNHYNRWLQDKGFTVVVLDYPKIPKHSLENQILHLKESIDLVMAYFNQKECHFNHLILSGRSAGGYLALAVGNLFERGFFSHFICFYPLVDFNMIFQEARSNDLLRWPWRLRKLFEDHVTSEKLNKYSFNSFTNLMNAKIICFHGTSDPVVPIQQSRKLICVENTVKARVVLIELQGQSHGFDVNLNTPAGQIVLETINRELEIHNMP